MAEHNVNEPEQPLPLITLGDFVPDDYSITIGNNNPRIDFNKLQITEESCRVVKDILLDHPYRYVLMKSTSVPIIYLHQFWHIALISLDDQSFTITLERTEYTMDRNVLRKALMLPEPEPNTQFAPMMSELEILDFFIQLGYDVPDHEPLTLLSRFNVKNLPQPWRTFYMLIIRSIAGRKSGHEHARREHLQVFWGIVSKTLIDFAGPIMDDMIHSIRTKGRKEIPFVRFTKMLIEYLCKDQPEYKQRMFNPDEPKHIFNKDFKISFVKSTMYATRLQGMQIPDNLLSDKIRQTKNYEVYQKAFQAGKVGFMEEEEPKTKMETRSRRGGRGGRTGSTSSTTTSQKSKSSPKPKSAHKPKKKVTPKQTFTDEESSSSSESESEFSTETDEDDYERVSKVTDEEEFPGLEHAMKESLESTQKDDRHKRGISINEPRAGDDVEEEQHVEQLVDKRRLKSIIIDNRAKDKEEKRRMKEGRLQSQFFIQPSSGPVNQPGSEGGTSSTQNILEGYTLITSTTEQPMNEEERDAEMKDATEEDADQEKELSDPDFNPLISPGYFERMAREEEIRKKEIEEKERLLKEAQEKEQHTTKQSQEQPEEGTEQEQPFDTDLFLQSPSHQQTPSPPPQQPPIPEDAPPKDPPPPSPSSSSESDKESSSKSSSHHSSPLPPKTTTTRKHKTIKRSIKSPPTTASQRVKKAVAEARRKKGKQTQEGEL